MDIHFVAQHFRSNPIKRRSRTLLSISKDHCNFIAQLTKVMSDIDFLYIFSISPAYFLYFLGTKDVVALDSACVSGNIRKRFLALLQGATLASLICTEPAAQWVVRRQVLPETICVNKLTTEADAILLSEVTSFVQRLQIVDTYVPTPVKRALFLFCPKLREIVWCSDTDMGSDPGDYFLLADSCPFLEEVSINYSGFAQADLPALLAKCKNVKAVDIRDCRELIAGQTLQSVADLGPRLVSLTINEVEVVDEGVFEQLAVKCPNLACLRIVEGIWLQEGEALGMVYVPVSPAGFAAFAPRCSSLRTLHLQTLHISYQDMRSLFMRCTGLRDLMLSQFTCELGPADWFQQLVAVLSPELSIIDLSRTASITNADVRALALRCSHLHTVNLNYIPHITADTTVYLAEHCPSLLRLRWGSVDNVNTNMFQRIAQSRPQLQTLGNKFVRISSSTVVEITVLCSNLVELIIAPGETLDFQPYLPHLQHLEMYFAGSVSAAVDTTLLSFVSCCSQLRSMRIFQLHEICSNKAVVSAIEENCPRFIDFYMSGFCSVGYYNALVLLQQFRAEKKIDFKFHVMQRAVRY